MGVLHPGQLLSVNYRVVREIGAGGMGVVYEIEHVRLRKRYVAKVIHEQIKDDDGAAKRMEREAHVLAEISHPNVVQVHDVGTTDDGVSYFVMEKLDGIDLRQAVKNQGLTGVRAIDIVADVLEALEYVHRRGIVHRDIKPENIFLSEQPHGTVTKVLDFGIVHVFDQDGRISQGRITKTGGFIGTLYYAAPEQMQGKVSGPPNDVYAAGLVLFELLAGRGPFDDDPGVGLSRCFKPAPTLCEFVPKAPANLSDAIAGALEQDPARRPSAGEFAAQLRRISATWKNTPHAGDDDPLRAEIDDLLRHMAPVDPAPRPAAGRQPTPADGGSAMPAPPTEAPATPLMVGAPGVRDPELLAAKAPVERTVAASEAPAAVAPAGAGASAAGESVPLDRTARSYLGQAGWGNSARSADTGPPSPFQDAAAHGGPGRTSPPAAGVPTAFSPGAERSFAPGPMVPAFPSSPPAHGSALPPQDNVSAAPAPPGDTSPGVYATVDHSTVARLRTRTWGPIAAGAGALVLALAVGIGAFVVRNRAPTADAATASSNTVTNASTVATALAPPSTSPAPSTHAELTPTEAAEPAPTKAPDPPPSAPKGAVANATSAADTTSTDKPPLGSKASSPTTNPSRALAPTTPQVARTPRATPGGAVTTKAAASTGAEKSGYVREF